MCCGDGRNYSWQVHDVNICVAFWRRVVTHVLLSFNYVSIHVIISEI